MPIALRMRWPLRFCPKQPALTQSLGPLVILSPLLCLPTSRGKGHKRAVAYSDANAPTVPRKCNLRTWVPNMRAIRFPMLFSRRIGNPANGHKLAFHRSRSARRRLTQQRPYRLLQRDPSAGLPKGRAPKASSCNPMVRCKGRSVDFRQTFRQPTPSAAHKSLMVSSSSSPMRSTIVSGVREVKNLSHSRLT